MVDLGNIADLRALDHALHCYCVQCDLWVVLDLAAIIRDGHGERRLPIMACCQDCGEVVQLPVRPPMSPRSCGGWISSP